MLIYLEIQVTEKKEPGVFQGKDRFMIRTYVYKPIAKSHLLFYCFMNTASVLFVVCVM